MRDNVLDFRDNAVSLVDGRHSVGHSGTTVVDYRSCWPFGQRSSGARHEVADAAPSNDVCRVCRIFTQLAAQSLHKRTYQFRVASV